jgi:hypothetical protein
VIKSAIWNIRSKRVNFLFIIIATNINIKAPRLYINKARNENKLMRDKN